MREAAAERREQWIAALEVGDGLAQALRRHFASAGYQVNQLASAQAALDWLKLNSTALLLVNQELSGDRDGLELLAHLKASGQQPAAILIARETSEGLLARALRQGVKDVIQRTPALGSNLIRAAERVLKEEAPRPAGGRKLNDSTSTLIQSAIDAILIVDLDRRIREFNPAAERMFGCAASEVLGTTVARFLPREFRSSDAEEVKHHGAAHSSLSASLPFQTHGVRGNGEVFPLETSISPFEAEGRKFYAIILRDLTERDRAARALQESEQRLRTLIESAPEAILLFDARAGRFTESNPMATKLFGLEQRELARRSVQDLSADAQPQAGPRLEEWIEATLQGKQPVFEWYFAAPDGPIPCEVRLVELPSAGRRLIRASVTDIRERKRAEELRHQFTQGVVKAQEEERRRLARDLHDGLGQSLTLLLFQLQPLRAQFHADASLEPLESFRAQVVQIMNETRRMARGLHPSVLDDLGLAPALISLVEDWQRSHGVAVELDGAELEAGRLPVHVEAVLYRIVQEALANIARHAHARRVTIAFRRSAAQVEGRIEDDGEGFQLDEGTKTDKAGLGLLSMQERAALLGGRVEIQSTPGKGTLILLSIPVGART
ncbi:MAG: PAS domain S-box protein [Gemmataceae bacterium]